MIKTLWDRFTWLFEGVFSGRRKNLISEIEVAFGKTNLKAIWEAIPHALSFCWSQEQQTANFIFFPHIFCNPQKYGNNKKAGRLVLLFLENAGERCWGIVSDLLRRLARFSKVNDMK